MELLAGAVTTGLIGQERLYLAKDTETDSHTTLAVRGREHISVETYNFAELCERVYPTFVKIDVEGAEYDMEIPASLTPSVQRLFIEWHFKRSGHQQRARALRDELLGQGFSVSWESRWADNVWWVEGMYTR